MTGNNFSHSIRKQDFDVEFNGTESDALYLQRTLPDLFHNRLIPTIEKALDRYAPANVYLTIDRMEIDAGSMTLDRLERELPQMVDKALEKYFHELPQTDALSNTQESAHIQRKTIQQTIIAAFIFFLKHGTLPWSFHLPFGSEFEELIQGSLKEPEGGGRSLELIKNEVIEVLASATARKRLIRQFTPGLPDTVLALISTEGKNLINGILPLLRRSDAALFETKQLEQEVLNCVFACIASGNPLTEASLRKDTQVLVMALGVRGASLAARLDSAPSPPPASSSQQSDGDADQTQLLTEQTDQSRQSEGADEAQKIVHHEQKMHDSVSTEGGEQLLKAPADLLRRSDGSDEEEKEARHQRAKAKESVPLSAIDHPDAKAGIFTALAGLVLLHPFLPQLFRALDIADDEKLLKPDRGIRLLYFLATGSTNAMEYELVIPKMLCHFPLTNAVESNVSLVADEQEEAVALLAAVVRNWEVMKNTGADGLRETFLKRSGKLSQHDDGEWLLQVESNSFDILLEQLPWGISMIQLPWMPRMLRVEWV
jgi:hypothetical protein